MRKLALIVAVVAIVACIYAVLHRRTSQHGIISVSVTSQGSDSTAYPQAPHLLLTDLNGHTIKTTDFQGKVVAVNFWAAWCTPCAAEVPHFITLQQKYESDGLQVIGISIDDSDKELRDFYQRYRMNYAVIAGDQKLAESYGGILGLPTTLVINRDGFIEKKFIGATDFATLEREIISQLERAPTMRH